MLIVNKFFKALAKLGVHLLCLLECYIVSIAFTSVVLSVIGALWSLFGTLPSLITNRYWLVLIIASIPLALVFFIIVELDLVKKPNENENIFKDFREIK